MTILLAVTSPTFAVLAADQLEADRLSDGTARALPEPHVKIRLHPRFPLAMAAAGPAYLPRVVGGTVERVDVMDFLGDILDGVQKPQKLRVGTLCEHVRRTFIKPVQLFRYAREKQDIPVDATETLHVIFALVQQGGAAFGQFRFDSMIDGLCTNEPYVSYMHVPFSLQTFYEGGIGFPDRRALFGFLPDPVAQGEHLRRAVEAGIAWEAAHSSDGLNHECGVGVNVAVVDSAGAKWL